MEFTPSPPQQMVLDSKKRFILAVGGVQSGKTTIGMVWLLLKLQEDLEKGYKGHYLIGVPTYKTWIQSTKVKFYDMFPKDWGDGDNLGWHEKDGYFKTVWGAHIYVRSVDEPNAIEGMTLRAAWLDEFGNMDQAVWTNIQARVGALKGSCIMTSTPYLGKFWVKTLVYDRASEVNGEPRTPDNVDSEIAVIQWKTKENPHFDKDEVERQRRQMSPELFALRYEGTFSAPHGLVYKDFNRDGDVVSPFLIPESWRRFGGIDFGFGSTTAVVCVAEKPAEVDKQGKPIGLPTFYVYREFYEKGAMLNRVGAFLTNARLSRTLGDPRGAQEMAELSRAYGVQHLTKADNEVKTGIEKLKVLFQDHRIKVFSNCKQTIDELLSYHYKLELEEKDSDGLPAKLHDHAMDALRYAFSKEFDKVYRPGSHSAAYKIRNLSRPVLRRSQLGAGDKYTGY